MYSLQNTNNYKKQSGVSPRKYFFALKSLLGATKGPLNLVVLRFPIFEVRTKSENFILHIAKSDPVASSFT